MSKKWIWISALAVVVLVAAAIIGVSVWFESPGIRVLGGDIHAEVSRVGYIIDSVSGKVQGQTPVTVNGSTSRTEKNAFDGELIVLGYQNSSLGTITATKMIEKTGDFYRINHLESCTHSEEEDGITQEVEHFCDYYYTWYLLPTDPDFLVVAVEDFEEEETWYVVCADNEAEALKTYKWFSENRPA